jgi:hypothetical protein
MLDRVNNLPLSAEKSKELDVITVLAENNGYSAKFVLNVYEKHNKKTEEKHRKNKKIWAKFTYFDNDIRILTKIFQNSPIRIAYNTNNTIKNNRIVRDQKDKCNRCGTYGLKCLTCDQVCVGQPGRNFKTRYEEHTNDIRLNKDKSKYSVHILQENHEYDPIDKTMEILKMANKGKYLDTWERFYIYRPPYAKTTNVQK